MVIQNNFQEDSKDGFKYFGINYTERIHVIINEIQELNDSLKQNVQSLKLENENHKTQNSYQTTGNESLQKMVVNQQSEIDELKARLDKLEKLVTK